MKKIDKTRNLHEVINDIENVINLTGADDENYEYFLFVDALKWLKGYQGHRELDMWKDKIEAKNPPLTWDELKSMEGKPVWIEIKKKLAGWEIVDYFGSDDKWMGTQRNIYDRDEMGTVWNAYLKEK